MKYCGKEHFRNKSYHVYEVKSCKHITVEFYFPFRLNTRDGIELCHVTGALLEHIALLNSYVTRLIKISSHTKVRLLYQSEPHQTDAVNERFHCHQMFACLADMLIMNGYTNSPIIENPECPDFLDYFIGSFEVLHNGQYSSLDEHLLTGHQIVAGMRDNPCLHRMKQVDITVYKLASEIEHQPCPRPDLISEEQELTFHWVATIHPGLSELYTWLDQDPVSVDVLDEETPTPLASDNTTEEELSINVVNQVFHTVIEEVMDFLKRTIKQLSVSILNSVLQA